MFFLMCSALDPRWRNLAFASEEERGVVADRLVREALLVEQAGSAETREEHVEEPAAKKKKGSRVKTMPGMDRIFARAQALGTRLFIVIFVQGAVLQACTPPPPRLWVSTLLRPCLSR